MIPFKALYGRRPPSIPYYQQGMTAVNEVDQQLTNRNELLAQLKENLQVANHRMQ